MIDGLKSQDWRSDVHKLCRSKAWGTKETKRQPPGSARSSSLTELVMMIEEVRAILAPLKRVRR